MREWVFKSYRPVDPYEALLDQARTILTFLTGRERDFGTEEQDQEQGSRAGIKSKIKIKSKTQEGGIQAGDRCRLDG